MKNNFIEKQKKLYKKLKPCFCPTLQETVHFNANGLHHVLYYRRRPRNFNERYYRAALISHLTEVISKATHVVQDIKSKKPLIITWALQYEVNDKKNIKRVVKVILERKGAGNTHFLSVMEIKRIRKTKKPKTKKS